MYKFEYFPNEKCEVCGYTGSVFRGVTIITNNEIKETTYSPRNCGICFKNPNWTKVRITYEKD